jgi:EAL domain-containing protein (putative c-di-GMP-specific phosphodiesterase class I)
MGEMAVNISAHQFRQPGLSSRYAPCWPKPGCRRRLELEITESTIMHGVDDRHSNMAELRAMGMRLAIDDFGTGYSSLAYLRRFPLDRLKIDRAFLADVDTDADAAALTSIVSWDVRSACNWLQRASRIRPGEFLRTLVRAGPGLPFYQPVPAEEVVDFGDVEGCVALSA